MQNGRNKVQYIGILKVEDSVMDTPKYKRVLLKISGEALAGDKKFGLDFKGSFLQNTLHGKKNVI